MDDADNVTFCHSEWPPCEEPSKFTLALSSVLTIRYPIYETMNTIYTHGEDSGVAGISVPVGIRYLYSILAGAR